MKTEQRRNIVYTITANCQDCYRCVRVCPVKAIKVIEGQAFVEDEYCIKCGTCVRECPQNAKTIRTSLEEVKIMIASGKKVAASVAPSFAAAIDEKNSLRLPTALRKLGFAYVSETAEGASVMTEESFKSTTFGNICTACPAVVDYIEKYQPEHIKSMIPVVSPMIAHGRMLKKRLGEEWLVVFIGPCAAKKQEACRPENYEAIDAVLTFAELIRWMEEEKIALEDCPPSGFESYGQLDQARLFPLQGGMLKTGNLDCDGMNTSEMHVSGAEEVMELFDLPADEWGYRVIEPLFCSGGCINGPGFPKEKTVFERKQDVIRYAVRAAGKDEKMNPEEKNVKLSVEFAPIAIDEISQEVKEEKIDEILEATGKSNPEMQLNCGACGYKTCRDNAIAVAKGMAEPEMCMAYIRRLAKQRTDRIIETTPNGIVIVDSMLNIVSMNPAFQKMFMCNNSILGKRISYLLDSDNYEKLVEKVGEQFDSVRTKYGIRYHENVYALRNDKQYVGIYSDLSNLKYDEKQIDLIKNQTLEHARELLTHQIRFSQEMAHYLGKSTAQGEEMVKRIMRLYDDKETF